ncbi:Ypt35p [Sporobolomyces salmoneus]|uniref:Ypt35p n=1 Tax=Sporobolomyces salmoneus TaxID=183962 RepID=UPI00317B5BBD
MSVPSRPPPPLRSYTETVQADVDDATSSSLFHLSLGSTPNSESPPVATLDPTSFAETTPTRRKRAPTLGNGDQLRRRRSNEEIRLPPAAEPRLSIESSSNNQGTPQRGTTESTGGYGRHAGIRRANSTDLLSIVSGLDDDSEDSDPGFSSEEEPFRFRPPSITSTTTSQRSSRVGIRIEDSSSRDSKVFVKQLTIPTYHAVGSEGSGFVVYDIEIQTLPTATSSSGTLIRAHKRYSAFVRLRADLINEFPRLRRAIPRLPPKSSLAKYRTSFLDKRRQNLAFWLTNVLLHPVFGGSSIARGWVLE